MKSAGLGDAAKKAAQALSEKYGIVTFDVKGDISTIPTTREIDTTINVGTGNKTESAFKKSIEKIIETQQKTVASDSGLFSGVTSAVNSFFNDIFNFDTSEPIPEEIADKIDAIDKEMEILRNQLRQHQENINNIARSNTNLSGLSPDQAIKAERLAMDNIEKQLSILADKRTKIFLEYKSKTEVTDKIRIMIDDLKALSNVEILTTDLKVTIQEKIQEASQTIERILSDKLAVPQSMINDLNRAMLLANERYKEPITRVQGQAEANMDGTAEILRLFPDLLTQKTPNEKALQLVEDYKVQKLAIQIALTQGVFSK